jgi:hypothetical protein
VSRAVKPIEKISAASGLELGFVRPTSISLTYSGAKYTFSLSKKAFSYPDISFGHDYFVAIFIFPS